MKKFIYGILVLAAIVAGFFWLLISVTSQIS